MANGRAEWRCDGCGQVTDHPAHHYGNLTFHHDCTPDYVLREMTSHNHFRPGDDGGPPVLVSQTPLPEEEWHPGVRKFMQVRQAALDGTHGADLVDEIQRLHEEE